MFGPARARSNQQPTTSSPCPFRVALPDRGLCFARGRGRHVRVLGLTHHIAIRYYCSTSSLTQHSLARLAGSREKVCNDGWFARWNPAGSIEFAAAACVMRDVTHRRIRAHRSGEAAPRVARRQRQVEYRITNVTGIVPSGE